MWSPLLASCLSMREKKASVLVHIWAISRQDSYLPTAILFPSLFVPLLSAGASSFLCSLAPSWYIVYELILGLLSIGHYYIHS